jgi:hypothetical protein
MNIVGAIFGSMGLAAMIYALLVLAQFSRKLGAVTKMREYYKGYYLAVAFVSLAFAVHLIRASVFWAPPDTIPPALNDPVFYLLLHHLPLAIGLSLGMGITWHYWNWLLKER